MEVGEPVAVEVAAETVGVGVGDEVSKTVIVGETTGVVGKGSMAVSVDDARNVTAPPC